MGAELTKKSTSKFILSEVNFQKLELSMLEYAGLSRKQIIIKDVEVDSCFNPAKNREEPIKVHTIFVGADRSLSLRK